MAFEVTRMVKVPVPRSVEDLCLFARYLQNSKTKIEKLTDEELAERALQFMKDLHGEE